MFSEAATWGWDLAAPDLARRPFGALPTPPRPGIACPSVSAVSHGCLSSLSATVSLNMSASAPNCSCCDTAHLNVGGGQHCCAGGQTQEDTPQPLDPQATFPTRTRHRNVSTFRGGSCGLGVSHGLQNVPPETAWWDRQATSPHTPCCCVVLM